MQTGSRSFTTVLSIMAAAACAAGVVLLAASLTTSREAAASMKYTQSTGKPCNFCHTTPPELNDQGKKFLADGHKL
jgi:hypothetical protein